MEARLRIRLLAFLGVSFLLLFGLGPLSADRDNPGRDRVRLVVPPVIGQGDDKMIGVQLSQDLQAQMRNRGGNLGLKVQGSRGHSRSARRRGNDAPRDGSGDPFEVTYSTEALSPGSVTLVAEATVNEPNGQVTTFVSDPVTTLVFGVSISGPASIAQGAEYSFHVTTNTDQVTILGGAWALESSSSLVLQSGSLLAGQFIPNGLGQSEATVLATGPTTYTGPASLKVVVDAQTLDLLGVPTSTQATTVFATEVVAAPVTGLSVAISIVSQQAHEVGSLAEFLVVVETPDSTKTLATYSIMADGVPLLGGSGTVPLVEVAPNRMEAVVGWTITAEAAGRVNTFAVIAQVAGQSAFGSVAFAVSVPVGATVAFITPEPVPLTAGQFVTAEFRVNGLASLAGVTLQKDIFLGGTHVIGPVILDSTVLQAQPDGSFLGALLFTISGDLVPVLTVGQVSLSLMVDGSAVASDQLDFTVQPAPAAALTILFTTDWRAGASNPVTFSVSNMVLVNVQSLSWSLLDGAGNVLVVESLPIAVLSAMNGSLVGSASLFLPGEIIPGDYVLRVAVERTDGTIVSGDHGVRTLADIRLRLGPEVIDGHMVEGAAEQLGVIARLDRVDFGSVNHFITDIFGVVVPGTPVVEMGVNEFQERVDDVPPEPARLAQFGSATYTVPPGTFATETQVRWTFVLTDSLGRVVVRTELGYTVQPTAAAGPRLSSLSPSSAIPGTAIQVVGSQLGSVGATEFELDYGTATVTVQPSSVSGDGTSATFRIPPDAPAADVLVRAVVSGTPSNSLPLRVLSIQADALAVAGEASALAQDSSLPTGARRQLTSAAEFLSGQAGFTVALTSGRLEQALQKLAQAARMLRDSERAGAGTADLQRRVMLQAKTIAEAELAALTRTFGAGDGSVVRARTAFQTGLAAEAAGDLLGATLAYVESTRLLVQLMGRAADVPEEDRFDIIMPIARGIFDASDAIRRELLHERTPEQREWAVWDRIDARLLGQRVDLEHTLLGDLLALPDLGSYYEHLSHVTRDLREAGGRFGVSTQQIQDTLLLGARDAVRAHLAILQGRIGPFAPHAIRLEEVLKTALPPRVVEALAELARVLVGIGFANSNLIPEKCTPTAKILDAPPLCLPPDPGDESLIETAVGMQPPGFGLFLLEIVSPGGTAGRRRLVFEVRPANRVYYDLWDGLDDQKTLVPVGRGYYQVHLWYFCLAKRVEWDHDSCLLQVADARKLKVFPVDASGDRLRTRGRTPVCAGQVQRFRAVTCVAGARDEDVTGVAAWSVIPRSLGNIDIPGLFLANARSTVASGTIRAKYKGRKGSTGVTVIPAGTEDIVPAREVVCPGGVADFDLYACTTHPPKETSTRWSLDPAAQRLGVIDRENGIFYATTGITGCGIVRAVDSSGKLKVAEIVVAEVDSITIEAPVAMWIAQGEAAGGGVDAQSIVIEAQCDQKPVTGAQLIVSHTSASTGRLTDLPATVVTQGGMAIIGVSAATESDSHLGTEIGATYSVPGCPEGVSGIADLTVVRFTLRAFPGSLTRAEHGAFGVEVRPLDFDSHAADVHYLNWRFQGQNTVLHPERNEGPNTWRGTIVDSGAGFVSIQVGSSRTPELSANVRVAGRGSRWTDEMVPPRAIASTLPLFPRLANHLGQSTASFEPDPISVRAAPVVTGPNAGYVYIQNPLITRYTGTAELNPALTSGTHPFFNAQGDAGEFTLTQIYEDVRLHEGLLEEPPYTSHWGQGRTYLESNPFNPDFEDDLAFFEPLRQVDVIAFRTAELTKVGTLFAALQAAVAPHPTNKNGSLNPVLVIDFLYPEISPRTVTVAAGAKVYVTLQVFGGRTGRSFLPLDPTVAITGRDGTGVFVQGVTPGATTRVALEDSTGDVDIVDVEVTP